MRRVAAVLTLALSVLAGVALSQTPPGQAAKPVVIVTLTRHGFTPKEVTLKPGPVRLVVRDLTGGAFPRFELLAGKNNHNAGKAVLATHNRGPVWKQINDLELALPPGEFSLVVAAAPRLLLNITAQAK